MKNNVTNDNYIDYLLNDNFNDEQINFLVKQVNDYHSQKESEYFYYDSYERDMWYTMNRCGLFENEETNKTEITEWEVNETRFYITDIPYYCLI